MSLLDAAVSGTMWMSAYRWIERVATFVTAVLLARLLSPTAFGLVALAMTVLGVLDALATPGLGTAVVQRNKIDKDDFDVAWTYDRFLMGILVGVGLFSVAPYAARFFDEPRLAAIVRVMALVPLIRIMENPAMLVMTRNLDYRGQFYLVASSSVARLIVVVPLAFIWKNVWVLVAGALVQPVARAVSSYVLYPRLPRFRYNWQRAIKLLRFGRWMWGLQIVKVMKNEFSRVIIGRVLGATKLGYFQVGTRFSSEITMEFYEVVSKVMWPIYSKDQNDNDRLRRNYTRVLNLILIAALPLCAGLFVLAEPLTTYILGQKWLPAVPAVRVLAVAGMLAIITGSADSLFRGGGSPRYEFAKKLLYVLVLAPTTIIGAVSWGFRGAVMAILITELSQVVVWKIFVDKLVGVDWRRVIEDSIPPVIWVFIMVGCVLATRGFVPGSSFWGELVLPVLVGALCYCACVMWGWGVMKLRSLVAVAEGVQRKLR